MHRSFGDCSFFSYNVSATKIPNRPHGNRGEEDKNGESNESLAVHKNFKILFEFSLRNLRLLHYCKKRPDRDRLCSAMKRNRHHCAGYFVAINLVAAFLSSQNKFVFGQNFHEFLGGKRLHYFAGTATSTSSTIGRDFLIGILSRCATSSSIHNSRTSLAFSFASSNVLPKVAQPGNAGKETLKPPSSAGSKIAV